MKKKVLSLFLVATLATSNAFTVLGANYNTTKSSSIIYIDGVKVTATPLLINASTYVPLRNLSETSGMTVDFDNNSNTINVKTTDRTPQEVPSTNNTTKIKTVEKSNSAIYVNGTKLTSDAVLVNGTTYVPLRNLTETAGMTVNFDDTTSVINIKTNGQGTSHDNIADTQNNNSSKFPGYKQIEVDGGNLSGTREPNVVVDVGFGDREYWAFTNEYGQLVKVTADKIVLQDDSKEPVTSDGRYYRDEAKVPGTEAGDLDEGHVIADSLGGVSNAYNITPQNSTLNRSGDQAYMEKVIRDVGGATNFTAIITYPNTTTQTPSHYSYTYTLNGRVINDEFDNVDPDKVNQNINNNTTNDNATSADSDVIITLLDKRAEVIVLKNNGNNDIDLKGWKIVSVLGSQTFTFPSYTLKAGGTVKVGDAKKNIVDFNWLDGNGTWNNSKTDPAEVYNANGTLIATNQGK